LPTGCRAFSIRSGVCVRARKRRKRSLRAKPVVARLQGLIAEASTQHKIASDSIATAEAALRLLGATDQSSPITGHVLPGSRPAAEPSITPADLIELDRSIRAVVFSVAGILAG
jgi:hypothetical protein